MDEAILRTVNGWAADPGIAAVGRFVSSPWFPLIVCVPLAFYLLYRRRFVAVASIALSMGAGDALTARILKPIFARERPCRALDGIVPAGKCGVGKSFPSGHATVSFAFYVSAAGTLPYGWVVLFPVAAAVAGSRTLLGVHYPSDVVAGSLVGSLVGFGFVRLRRKAEDRWEKETDPEAED